MGLFRSEKMVHKKIRIPRESANVVIRALGNLKNSIEFEDLTSDKLNTKKNFQEMIVRCDENLKKIADFMRVSADFHVKISQYKTYDSFRHDLDEELKAKDNKFGSAFFDLAENEINENDRRLKELVDSHSQIRDDLVSLVEKKYVYMKSRNLMEPSFQNLESGEDGIKHAEDGFNYMAGVVSAENELKMRRMIFRISRGRAITSFFNLDIGSKELAFTTNIRQRAFSIAKGERGTINNLLSGLQKGEYNTNKKIFNIIFPGGSDSFLLSKILKVCEIYQAARYPVPKGTEIQNELNGILQEISEKSTLLVGIERTIEETLIHSNMLLNKKGYRYSLLRLFFEQEKLVYGTLNKFNLHESFLDGKVWIPEESIIELEICLKNIFKSNDNNTSYVQLEDDYINNNFKYPTYIEVNDFTKSFQSIVDTYGIPRYKEVNPGYFCIITFPFLFGVMFGDIGHGLILFLISLYIILNEKGLRYSIIKDLIDVKWFLLLMGIYALFCGLLYNDFLGLPLYITSCYPLKNDTSKGTQLERISGCKYKFGIDPIWMVSMNELGFVNSLKMKLSVILGVSQMVLGILLKGCNHLYLGEWSEIFFGVVPQIAMMVSLFGYMDFLIFYKWNTDYTTYLHRAPDIKTYLMNIFIKLGKLPNKPKNPITQEDEDWILITDRDTMESLHLYLLIIFLVSALLMFIPKIIADYVSAKKRYGLAQRSNMNIGENDLGEELMDYSNIDEEPRFTDFLVNNVIETIEFVLGTVSNTASYLRLWALSLAHSQLSIVFFEMLITPSVVKTKNWFFNGIFLSFFSLGFLTTTIIVLLFMDMMECFLHTLRLHWVEFQGKFFKADGRAFVPFCFAQNLMLELEEYAEQ